MEIFEMPRLCGRRRGNSMSPGTLNNGEGGLEYGGEGGRGEIVLWKERRESTLDRVEGSLGLDLVVGVHGLSSDDEEALTESWIGAVTARPVLNVVGRTGNMELSTESESLLEAIESVPCSLSPLSFSTSSSTLLALLLSESAVIYSSALSCSSSTLIAAWECSIRAGGLQGRLRTGVVGGSGS